MSIKTKKVYTLVPLVTRHDVNGGGAPTISYSYPTHVGTETKNSVGLKGYKTLISNSQSATTPFSASRNTVDSITPYSGEVITKDLGDPPSYWRRKYSMSGMAGVEASSNPSHLSTDFTSANNKALSKLYSAIKSQQQQMSGFTFLGELRETIHGIRNPVEALIKGLDRYYFTLGKYKSQIRHHSVKARKRAIVDISTGLWLEASFGWMPLLQDVKGIAETLARFQYDNRHSEARGFGETVLRSSTAAHVALFGELAADKVSFKETKHTVVYRCGIKARDTLPPIGSINRLRELCGFNLQDFVPSLYQLTPNSWLLDYFANVGDIVEAACTSTADVTWINLSQIRSTTEQVVYTPVWDKGGISYSVLVSSSFSPGRIVKSLKTVDRTQVLSLGLPSLEFSLPGGLNKYANLGALYAAKSRKTLIG